MIRLPGVAGELGHRPLASGASTHQGPSSCARPARTRQKPCVTGPAARPRLLRRSGDHGGAGADRQRALLQVTPVTRCPGRTRHQAQAHPPLPAPDQRQGRAVQPDPGRGMGLRPPLHQRDPEAGGVPGMAARLQSPPVPHRDQRPSRLPCSQPLRSVHLDGGG